MKMHYRVAPLDNYDYEGAEEYICYEKARASAQALNNLGVTKWGVYSTHGMNEIRDLLRKTSF